MFMGDEQAWAERYDKAATEFLGQPVLACVQGTRTKGWSSLALGQISGAAGMVQQMRGKKAAAGLPQMFLVAVTADRLHVLGMPKMNWNVKNVRAVKELAVWNRSDIQVSAESVFQGIKVAIDSPSEGEHVELQVPQGFVGERVLEALGAGVPA